MRYKYNYMVLAMEGASVPNKKIIAHDSLHYIPSDWWLKFSSVN